MTNPMKRRRYKMCHQDDRDKCDYKPVSYQYSRAQPCGSVLWMSTVLDFHNPAGNSNNDSKQFSFHGCHWPHWRKHEINFEHCCWVDIRIYCFPASHERYLFLQNTRCDAQKPWKSIWETYGLRYRMPTNRALKQRGEERRLPTNLNLALNR